MLCLGRRPLDALEEKRWHLPGAARIQNHGVPLRNPLGPCKRPEIEVLLLLLLQQSNTLPQRWGRLCCKILATDLHQTS